jgi:hypothetical protein
MGRVNSDERMKRARLIGCDSVDGTSYVKFTARHLPGALRLLSQQALEGIG